MSVSPIVWEVVQKTSAQAVKQNNLELAAKTLAAGVEPDFVQKLFKLTDEEFQDLLHKASDQSQVRPL